MLDLVMLFFLFGIGMIFGVVPPYIWGKNGGDEGLIVDQPHLKYFLKLIHHWQIGIVIMIIGILVQLFLFQSEINIFVAGWGTSTFLDDALFHSFEQYFARKNLD